MLEARDPHATRSNIKENEVRKIVQFGATQVRAFPIKHEAMGIRTNLVNSRVQIIPETVYRTGRIFRVEIQRFVNISLNPRVKSEAHKGRFGMWRRPATNSS